VALGGLQRPVGAQERLFARAAVGGGAHMSVASFGSDGIQERGLLGDGSTLRVERAQELTFPFSAAFRISSGWAADVGGALSRGTVRLLDAGGVASDRDLSGVSDVRVRLRGALLGDGLVLTLGANIPTGQQALDSAQLSVLRVLAAPSLGLQLPAVSFGASGTAGLVASRVVGEWIVAAGGSYEYRGQYSPVAALQAGADPEFDPGNVLHLSAGVERFVGESRLSLQAGADLYDPDRLRAGPGGDVQEVALGPVYTADARLDMATERVSDAQLYLSARQRSTFKRDGQNVEGGAGTYLNAGYRGGIPVGRRGEVRVGVDGLWHSGLDVDETLMTAQAQAASLTLGWRLHTSRMTFDPFVRGTAGSIDTGISAVRLTGLTAGLTLTARF